MYAKERRVCSPVLLLKIFTGTNDGGQTSNKKKIKKNCKTLSLKPMLAANSFADHKTHHININHMYKVLTAIKMPEVLASVLKM